MINITKKVVDMTADYYESNKEKIENKQRDRYKNLPKEEKDVIKDSSLRRYYKIKNKL